MTAFRKVSISLLFCFLYFYVFYATADTPLNNASLDSWRSLISTALTISLGIGLTFQAFFSTTSKLVFKTKNWKDRAENFFVFLITFSMTIVLCENFLYTVFLVGLKTTSGIFIKLGVATAAGIIALNLMSVIVWLARFRAPIIYIFGCFFFVIVPSAQKLASSFADTDKSSVLAVKEGVDLPHIIILSSDGISARYMSVYGADEITTPFLNSISSELLIFSASYPNSANTTGGTTSLLTGRSPLATQVVFRPDVLRGRDTLKSMPALLGELGFWRTQWSVPIHASGDSLNFQQAFDAIFGKPQLIQNFIFSAFEFTSIETWVLGRITRDQVGVLSDVLYIKELQNPNDEVAEEGNMRSVSDAIKMQGLISDIEGAVQNNRNLFNFTHLMGTHGPQFSAPRIFTQGKNPAENWSIPRYQDAILEFDSRVKIVYETLRELGILENSVLVITSDHGLRWSTSERIPLLIRFPNTRVTGISDQYAQSLDIAPTILNLVGLTKPAWMDGRDLIYTDRNDDARLVIQASRLGSVSAQESADARQSFWRRNYFSAVYCGYYSGRLKFPEPSFQFFSEVGNKADQSHRSVECDGDLTKYQAKILEAISRFRGA